MNESYCKSRAGQARRCQSSDENGTPSEMRCAPSSLPLIAQTSACTPQHVVAALSGTWQSFHRHSFRATLALLPTRIEQTQGTLNGNLHRCTHMHACTSRDMYLHLNGGLAIWVPGPPLQCLHAIHEPAHAILIPDHTSSAPHHRPLTQRAGPHSTNVYRASPWVCLLNQLHQRQDHCIQQLHQVARRQRLPQDE